MLDQGPVDLADHDPVAAADDGRRPLVAVDRVVADVHARQVVAAGGAGEDAGDDVVVDRVVRQRGVGEPGLGVVPLDEDAAGVEVADVAPGDGDQRQLRPVDIGLELDAVLLGVAGADLADDDQVLDLDPAGVVRVDADAVAGADRRPPAPVAAHDGRVAGRPAAALADRQVAAERLPALEQQLVAGVIRLAAGLGDGLPRGRRAGAGVGVVAGRADVVGRAHHRPDFQRLEHAGHGGGHGSGNGIASPARVLLGEVLIGRGGT